MMDVATFLNNFELIVQAPNGVQKIREALLGLALRGYLVPQDPADEPAEDLLGRIESDAAMRSRRTATVRPRANKKLPELPKGWTWAPFSAVTESRLGKMLDKAKNTGKHRPYLRNANVQWFRF